jgi:hypothetical protein
MFPNEHEPDTVSESNITNTTTSVDPIQESIEEWSKTNPSILQGAIYNVSYFSRWAYGERRTVQTTNSDYLFYMESDGSVATVYQYVDGILDRSPIWDNGRTLEDRNPKKEYKQDKSQELPAYEVRDRYAHISGNGDIAFMIVPNLKRDTPNLEEICRAIHEKEGLYISFYYNTYEAFKADGSQSYSDSHPGASKGNLGSIDENGIWHPSASTE